MALPVNLRFGWGGTPVFVAFFVAAAIVFSLTYLYVQDIRFIGGLMLSVLLTTLSTQVPDWSFRYRSVALSGEGIRVEHHFASHTLIHWSSLRSMTATSDLGAIRIVSDQTTVSLSLQRRKLEDRVSLASTLRAYAHEYGVNIEEWPSKDLRLRRGISTSFHVAAGLVFVGTLVFFGPGGTLGIRCAANSPYMQKSFGTPDRAGCVVVRVSAGAAKAGIHRGDLMIEMNGYPVTSGQQFQALFDNTKGNPWHFKMIRTGDPEPLEFTVRGAPGKNFSEDSNDPIFYYLRARWDASDDPESAISDYTRAIELDPQFDLAYLYRAQLYEEANRYDDASRDYEKALELSPDFAEANYLSAHFLYPSRYEVGRNQINKAIRLDNCDDAFESYNVDCAYDYWVLAVYNSTGFFANMRDEAEQSIRFYPRDAFPYFLAACAHSRLGESAEAVQRAHGYFDAPNSDGNRGRANAMQALIADGAIC